MKKLIAILAALLAAAVLSSAQQLDSAKRVLLDEKLAEYTAAIEREHRITETLDIINNAFGDGTIKLAVQGSGRIRSTRENQSPHYTTRWSDLPKVSVK